MVLSRRTPVRPPVWRPPTDLYETETTVVVRVEIAGMRTADFKISLESRTLTIHGTRPDITERRAFHQMEIGFGEFTTEVGLPCPVVAEEVQAEYSKGFLRVELPKLQPQVIEVHE